MKSGFARTLLILAAVTLALAGPAGAYSGERYAKDAKISLAEATTIALKTRPGRITDRELEHERGGSGLRYSFDIKANGHAYEVGVDAATGAVLENSTEGKNPD
jgi:uncharacterized membrane protein YkoI